MEALESEVGHHLPGPGGQGQMSTTGFTENKPALTGVAQVAGHRSHKAKGHQFEFWSGYMPGLWVRALVRAWRGNQ